MEIVVPLWVVIVPTLIFCYLMSLLGRVLGLERIIEKIIIKLQTKKNKSY